MNKPPVGVLEPDGCQFAVCSYKELTTKQLQFSIWISTPAWVQLKIYGQTNSLARQVQGAEKQGWGTQTRGPHLGTPIHLHPYFQGIEEALGPRCGHQEG